MTRKKTLEKVAKSISVKFMWHDRNKYLVILRGFDNDQNTIAGVILKDLKKKVSKEDITEREPSYECDVQFEAKCLTSVYLYIPCR